MLYKKLYSLRNHFWCTFCCLMYVCTYIAIASNAHSHCVLCVVCVCCGVYRPGLAWVLSSFGAIVWHHVLDSITQANYRVTQTVNKTAALEKQVLNWSCIERFLFNAFRCQGVNALIARKASWASVVLTDGTISLRYSLPFVVSSTQHMLTSNISSQLP